jgi:nucleotide-binding universal stress UspA family protein
MSAAPLILHPTDFSESAGHAFPLAVALARSHGARLLVLHVPAPLPAVVDPRQVGQPFDTLRRQLEQLRPAAPGVSVEHRLTPGDPVEEILKTARETGCALIVMGTQGRSGLTRLLMGSVAEQVVRRAPCPVVTERVPLHTHIPAAKGPSEAVQSLAAVPMHTLLHPTDFSEPCAAAFRVACALARDQSARVIVLHVGAPPFAGPSHMPVPLPEPADQREKLEQMLHRLQASVPDVAVDCRIAQGERNAATSIVEVAQRIACDLIVMGTNGRTGLGRALLGSVAELVLRTAPCPVVTVRASAGA